MEPWFNLWSNRNLKKGKKLREAFKILAGEMAQCIKGFLSMCEDLSSDPQKAVKRHTVAGVNNPSVAAVRKLLGQLVQCTQWTGQPVSNEVKSWCFE